MRYTQPQSGPFRLAVPAPYALHPSGSILVNVSDGGGSIVHAGNNSGVYAKGVGVAFSGGGATVTPGRAVNIDAGFSAIIVFSPNVSGVKGSLISVPASCGETLQFATNTANGLQADRQGTANIFSTASLGIVAGGVYTAGFSYTNGGLLTAAFEGRIVASATPSAPFGGVATQVLIGRRSGDLTETLSGGVLEVWIFDRKLSNYELQQYTANPWQLFKVPQRIYAAPAGGGPQTYSYTASGGMVLSGVSTKVRGIARVPTGGLNLSGGALTNRGAIRTPSGGLSLSGAATTLRGRVLAGLGGMSLSGAASLVFTSAVQSLTVTPVGGIIIRGTSAMERTVVRAVSGGITFAGHAATTFTPDPNPPTAHAFKRGRRPRTRKNY